MTMFAETPTITTIKPRFFTSTPMSTISSKTAELRNAAATRELKGMLADAMSMLEQAEIIDFNGHFSARIPGADRMLINSGKSVRSALRPDDFVSIDFDGKPLEGEPVPPMEFHIHSEIYRRRPDVQAVVHTHPVWSTLFSMCDKPLRPVIMQAALLGDIQTYEKTASINQKHLGEEVAAALGEHRVVMLRSHGSVIASEGVIETFALAVYLEETARRQYLAEQIGTPRDLDPKELDAARRNLWKPHLLRKVWDYHSAKR
jgi:ribulose-5-phosphate 4-epimerase/fuculose-1-phosphate aldolase